MLMITKMPTMAETIRSIFLCLLCINIGCSIKLWRKIFKRKKGDKGGFMPS